MTTEYSYDKQLIKDFIRWASDERKCAMVCFPDEFAVNSYVNYKFINVGEMINDFIEERKE